MARKKKPYVVVGWDEYDNVRLSHLYRIQCPIRGCQRTTFPGRDWRGRWMPNYGGEACCENHQVRAEALDSKRECDYCKRSYIPSRDYRGRYRPQNGEADYPRDIHTITEFHDSDGMCSDECRTLADAEIVEAALAGDDLVCGECGDAGIDPSPLALRLSCSQCGAFHTP